MVERTSTERWIDRTLWWVRWVAAGVVAVYVATGAPDERYRLTVGGAAAIGTLLSSNLVAVLAARHPALRRWSSAGQLGLDTGFSLCTALLLVEPSTFQPVPTILLAVVAEAAARRYVPGALAVGAVGASTIAAARLLHWPQPPPVAYGVREAAIMWVTVVVTAVLLGRLFASRERTLEELSRTHAELSRAHSALAASYGALERFAHRVAHDLRTPLTVVGGLAATLARSTDSQDQRLLADRIVANVERMSATISSYLEEARVDGHLPSVPVDLGAVVRDVLETYSTELSRTGAEVRVDPLPVVSGDRALIEGVVANLLANALLHRDPSVPPRVTITAHRRGPEWCIAVRDNGPGIPRDRRDDVFEPGVRLDHRRGGTGLGLATCRDSVRALGGRIWIEDAPEGGTAVCFTLPSSDGARPHEPDRRVAEQTEQTPVP